MSMPSPAMNVFDVGKAPVCEHICLQRLLSVSKLLCALLLPLWFVCLKSSVSCISTSAASLFQKQTLQGRYISTGLNMRISTDVCHTWHISWHSSSSFIVIRQPYPASFIVHHQHHPSIIIHRHSLTSPIIIHLTLSCYLLLPNSFLYPLLLSFRATLSSSVPDIF